MFALKFTQGTAHGDARYPMRQRKIVFIGQPRAETKGSAHDPVAQDQIDLTRLGFLQPIRHYTPRALVPGEPQLY